MSEKFGYLTALSVTNAAIAAAPVAVTAKRRRQRHSGNGIPRIDWRAPETDPLAII